MLWANAHSLLGGYGGMLPQEILNFTLSEIDSDAIWSSNMLYFSLRDLYKL